MLQTNKQTNKQLNLCIFIQKKCNKIHFYPKRKSYLHFCMEK